MILFPITIYSTNLRYNIFVWFCLYTFFIGFPRANSHCEGWHNRMAKNWGVHPNIFTFINELKKEQDLQEMQMARIEAGATVAARDKKYVKMDQKLIELVKAFDKSIHDGSYMPYLKSIAHNTRF